MHTVQSGLLYYYLKRLHISDFRIPSLHPDSPSPHRPEGSPAVAFIRFAQYDALQARPWAATGSVPLVDLFLTTCAVPVATAPTGGGGDFYVSYRSELHLRLSSLFTFNPGFIQ